MISKLLTFSKVLIPFLIISLRLLRYISQYFLQFL